MMAVSIRGSYNCSLETISSAGARVKQCPAATRRVQLLPQSTAEHHETTGYFTNLVGIHAQLRSSDVDLRPGGLRLSQMLTWTGGLA
jgi:hypothetical protein